MALVSMRQLLDHAAACGLPPGLIAAYLRRFVAG